MDFIFYVISYPISFKKYRNHTIECAANEDTNYPGLESGHGL